MQGGYPMKLCKRLLAAFLMLVLSVSVLMVPASAAGWKYDRAYQQYKGKTYKVCRLIAETFIPNPASKPLVIHKDNDPSNNCVDNLFWGDYKDMQYNSKKNKPTYEKLGVDPYDRKAARKAQYKIWKSNHPRLQFAGHVWHRVTQEEFNLLRPIPWKERSLPERYRK